MTERRFESEADLTREVIRIAHEYGWKVARFHRLPTTKGGWRTPVGADGKGYPDLTLVRERVIFAELKIRPRKPDVNQQAWQDWLATTGAEVYVWTDRDLEQIERTLKTVITPLRLAQLVIACGGDITHARAVTQMVRTA